MRRGQSLGATLPTHGAWRWSSHSRRHFSRLVGSVGKEKEVVPRAVQRNEGLVETANGEPITFSRKKPEPLELRQGIVDLKIDIDGECLLQPLLDAGIERLLIERPPRRQQEVV